MTLNNLHSAPTMPQEIYARAVLHKHRLPKREAGTALIMSLVFLLVLTIFGVTAMTTSTLNEKMAANMKDQQIALQSAESAIRAAEAWLFPWSARIPVQATNPGTTGVWAFGVPGNFTDAAHDYSWWNTNGIEYGLSGTQEITQAAADPRYTIEERAFISDSPNVGLEYAPNSGKFYYRITAHGYGATQSAETILQSHFVHRF